MGVVEQDVSFLRTLTVLDVVRGAAARAGVASRQVDAALAEMGIEDLASRRASMLLGGQQQRLQLAMGLVTDPVLLVLDELTAGPDVLARRTLWESVSSRAASGAGVVLTTHIVGVAEVRRNGQRRRARAVAVWDDGACNRTHEAGSSTSASAD